MGTLKKKIKSVFNGLNCRLFHPIETISNCDFIDRVTGKSVGKFKCIKCEKTYLANNKRDFFRCYV